MVVRKTIVVFLFVLFLCFILSFEIASCLFDMYP